MTVAKLTQGRSHDVVTVNEASTVHDATRLLEQYRIGALPVVDSNNSLCGILSERDIVQAIARNGAGILSRPVSAFMTADVITCSRGDTVANVSAVMTKGKFRHVPIVEDGQLVDIISIGDVVKYRIEQAESEAAAMREYITTG